MAVDRWLGGFSMSENLGANIDDLIRAYTIGLRYFLSTWSLESRKKNLKLNESIYTLTYFRLYAYLVYSYVCVCKYVLLIHNKHAHFSMWSRYLLADRDRVCVCVGCKKISHAIKRQIENDKQRPDLEPDLNTSLLVGWNFWDHYIPSIEYYDARSHTLNVRAYSNVCLSVCAQLDFIQETRSIWFLWYLPSSCNVKYVMSYFQQTVVDWRNLIIKSWIKKSYIYKVFVVVLFNSLLYI